MTSKISPLQVQYSVIGEPTHLVIPVLYIDSFYKIITEEERETVEILSSPWWSTELSKRAQEYISNKTAGLKKAVSLSEFKKNHVRGITARASARGSKKAR